MPATAEAANASKKTYTNWEAFAKAGLIPATLRCQSYKPVHLSDSSCHSNLKFDAATLKRHFDGEHGGGFWVDVRKTEGKPDRKSTRLNSSHVSESRMPSSA